MEEEAIVETSVYPTQINTFAIPNDLVLKRVYNVYKPSLKTITLISERGRTIYPEVFIINNNLGTLADLCVRVLARSFGPQPNPIVASNPMHLQVHYDALDVDLPLAKCYDIAEERFWRRVVLKYKDKTLAIKPQKVNWKNVGVSLKYVQMVEESHVEYWQEEEMEDLARKMKEFVCEMHIKRLQSLKERSFDKYFQSESESVSSESDIDDDSATSVVATSTEEETDAMGDEEKTESQLELEAEKANKKAQRKKLRQDLRDAKQKAREAKAVKRKRYEARRTAKEKSIKNPLKKIPANIFDIEVSESEDDAEDRLIDKRNKALFLRRIKKYNYPSKDCHHINLKFIQHFTNLETFTIEFLGPIQNCNYHKRHLNFSYDDIKHLAMGLHHLSKLKTFRLRNSRMDAEKLQILCGALGLLPNLENLDFGHDQLRDDCGFAFKELFQITKSLKSLELESNCLGEQVLNEIGRALNDYNVNELLYLGLARNPLTDGALHGLVSAAIGTKHIEELNIRGVKFVTDVGLCCCLANELLKQHPTLVKIDICAIQIAPRTADEIVKSLDKNEKILQFYCCGCNLDEETEIDINIILRRNKYISENYYLRDPTITNEEITKWLNRTRNPILLKVLSEREKHKQCLQNSAENTVTQSLPNSPAVSRHTFPGIKSQLYEEHLNGSSLQDMDVATESPQHFVYPANDFDEQEFLEHVFQPGPQERYYYLKMYKEKYTITDSVKNLSII